MVMRKRGVEIAVERHDVNFPGPEQIGDERPGGAVSAVHGGAQSPRAQPDPFPQHGGVRR